MGKIQDWRALIAAGLVFVLTGALTFDTIGGTIVVIGLICLVTGGAWRILRGPDQPTNPE